MKKTIYPKIVTSNTTNGTNGRGDTSKWLDKLRNAVTVAVLVVVSIVILVAVSVKVFIELSHTSTLYL